MNYKKHVGRSLIVALLLSGSMTMNAQKVTYQFKEASLKTALKEVEKQLQFSIIYKKGVVNEDKLITENFENASLEDVLTSILGEDLTWTIQGKMIVISKKEHYQPWNLQQQKQKRISGIIKDATGEPIIGANVVEKGTTNGTVTDMDGKFSLDVQNNGVLQVSYIGYLTKEIPVSGKSSFNVILSDDSQNLNEVVVVGYGTQKKVNLTGAVSTVKSEMLENRTTSNTVNMLTGQIAGVTIVQNTGQPGVDAGNLRVRGIGTLGNAEAMVVIDGVESSMSNVDPNDIESISVLKDAAASSIYGVRAANGVILITTKRGAVGKPVVSYNGYIGWQSACRLPNFLDSYNYATLLNEAYSNDQSSAPFGTTDMEKIRLGNDPDHFANSNQVDALLSENGLFHNHHLSVIGGNEGILFFGGRIPQEGRFDAECII